MLQILWAFRLFLSVDFIKAIITLITKGIIFAESNYHHEPGEIQKQKCLDFIEQGYDVIDLEFKFPEDLDGLIKNTLIPSGVDLIVNLLKNTGLMPTIERVH